MKPICKEVEENLFCQLCSIGCLPFNQGHVSEYCDISTLRRRNRIAWISRSPKPHLPLSSQSSNETICTSEILSTNHFLWSSAFTSRLRAAKRWWTHTSVTASHPCPQCKHRSLGRSSFGEQNVWVSRMPQELWLDMLTTTNVEQHRVALPLKESG
jgi:hypothetical protein